MRPNADWIIDAVRRSSDHDSPPVESWDTEAALACVKARDVTQQVVPLHSERGVRTRHLAVLIAASIAVTVGVGLVMRRLPGSAVPDRVAVPSTILTTNGERRTVRLPDGTEVTVGPRSRLEVAAQFAKADRTVSLDGDAYFRVVHDPSRPFSIAAGRGVVRVIGTEFAVRAYAEDSTTLVAVVDGRVSVAAKSATTTASGVVLSPGDIGSVARRPIDGTDTVTVTNGADLSTLVAWTHGELAFVGTPLREVSAILERWYGVDLIVDSLLTDRRVTASFTNRPFPAVLAGICGVLRARCERQGNRATIHPATR